MREVRARRPYRRFRCYRCRQTWTSDELPPEPGAVVFTAAELAAATWTPRDDDDLPF